MQPSGLGIVISRTHSLVVAVAVVTFSVRFHSAPGTAFDGSLYKSSPTTYASFLSPIFARCWSRWSEWSLFWISIFSLFSNQLRWIQTFQFARLLHHFWKLVFIWLPSVALLITPPKLTFSSGSKANYKILRFIMSTNLQLNFSSCHISYLHFVKCRNLAFVSLINAP